MHSPGRPIQGSRLVIGLFAVLLGVLFQLDNLGMLYADDVWRWWPAVIIAIGLVRLLQAEGRRSTSLIITGLGVLLLLENLRWLDFDVWELWPLVLVLLGLSMVWGALSGRRGTRSGPSGLAGGGSPGLSGGSANAGLGGGGGFPSSSAGANPLGASPAGGVRMDAGAYVKASAILASCNRGSNSIDFRGGDVTAVLGGCELDLRQATIAGTEAVLDVFAFWGGIDIRVPEDWTVVVHATPLLGGVSDETRRPATPGKQLVVKGLVVMGGVDIKN